MSNGEKIKQNLGLSTFQHVKIRRLVSPSSVPIYQVVFNSRFPNLPLTTYQLRNNPLMPFIVDTTYEKFYATPYIPIENFNGSLHSKIFVCSDIAGMYGKKKNYDFFLESKILVGQGKLKEFITLPALANKQANVVSPTTDKYKKIRKKVQKTANINTKLISTELENTNVIFKFLTEATNMYKPNHKYSQINPETKTFEPNPSKTYEIWIKLLNVTGDNGWLSTFNSEEDITRKDIKDIIQVSDCQLWSNDPSFQYQGFNYWLGQLDAAIYSTDIAPQKWDKYHGDGLAFLTKHISQLIDQLPFFYNQMAASLSKVLKSKRLI